MTSTNYNPFPNPTSVGIAAATASQNAGTDKSVKLPAYKQGLGTASEAQNNVQNVLTDLTSYRKSGSESDYSSMKTHLEQALGTLGDNGPGDQAAAQIRSHLASNDYDGLNKDIDGLLQKDGDASHSQDATAYVNALKTDGQAANISATPPAGGTSGSTGSTGSTSGSTGNTSGGTSDLLPTEPKNYDWQKMSELYKNTGK